jgi:hypothetical protein
LALDPIHGSLIIIDIRRIGITNASLAIALASKPGIDAIMTLALIYARNVLAQITIQNRAIIPLTSGLTAKVTARRSQHKPVLLKNAKIR